MKNIGARLRALGVPEIFEERTASRETYTTDEGVVFTIDHREFASALGRLGYKGVELGRRLRGEETISDGFLRTLVREHGAKVKKGRPYWAPEPKPRKKLPRLYDLWDTLVQAVYQAGEKNGAGSAADMFVNMPRGEDDFYQYLQGVSGDMVFAMEYALEGRTEKLYSQYMKLLKTGEYELDHYSRGEYDNARWVKERLGESFSEGWFSGAWAKWERLPAREKARLQSLRPS